MSDARKPLSIAPVDAQMLEGFPCDVFDSVSDRLRPLLLGFVTGILTVLLGVGGGFIMVPAMIYLLRVPTSVVVTSNGASRRTAFAARSPTASAMT